MKQKITDQRLRFANIIAKAIVITLSLSSPTFIMIMMVIMIIMIITVIMTIV